MQHHTACDAIVHGQGARAEAIMRDHANATLRYAELLSGTDESRADMHVIGAQADLE